MLWQTWALAIIGVVVGIPAGVVLGRTTWRVAATQIGSVQQPAVPTGAIGILVLLAAITTTLVSLVPAFTAARVNSSAALRQE